ncbi:unnamed protein product [Rotaria sordida]|uniref:Beta-mannosidase-like galactose-binding domain-containing protein n=1 Tax=Rotaria sordida TaxID=392033 RepID=A0A814CZ15_9BILA|nr:unnamed protein product [Rotaria sordida]CAF3737630.1 unnamed protein product [Rotaria sordida]
MRRDVEGSTGLHRLGLLMAKMGEWDKAKDIYELLIGKTDNDQHLMLGSLHHQLAQGNIPGAIHTVFFAAKQIPDPYLDYNDIDLRYLIYNNWTFTKKIDLFSDFLASNQTTIHLKQIDTVAIITINNYLIGRTNSMFMPYTIHIANSCLKFENEISIGFESPVLYALKQANAYNDTVPSDCPSPAQHGECYVQFIRKESCSFSWDWVSIESKNKTNIFIWRRS